MVLKSVPQTRFATLRTVKTEPASTPIIWLATTRASEQPIHMYLGWCSEPRRLKNSGSFASCDCGGGAIHV